MFPDDDVVVTIIKWLICFGDIVFAISGALAAGRKKMDLVGFMLIGSITALGGGTIRDVLLDRQVWWAREPLELIISLGAAIGTFFLFYEKKISSKALIWFDALGLSAFTVVGCNIAMELGAHPISTIFMGVVSATGGGVMRDVLTDTPPMITKGQLYATAALAGAVVYVLLITFIGSVWVAAIVGALTTLAIRVLAVVYDIHLGPPRKLLVPGGDE